jgi:hypothetical protein
MISSGNLWIFYKIGESAKNLNHFYDLQILGKIVKLKQIEGKDLTLTEAITKEEKKIKDLVSKIPKTF